MMMLLLLLLLLLLLAACCLLLAACCLLLAACCLLHVHQLMHDEGEGGQEHGHIVPLHHAVLPIPAHRS